MRNFLQSNQFLFFFLLLRLDVGDGKEINLEKCPRTKLHHQCIKYLGPVSSYSEYSFNRMYTFVHGSLDVFKLLLDLITYVLQLQKERESYEVVIDNRKLVYKQSGVFVQSVEGSKSIFILSTVRTLYVGPKQKAHFNIQVFYQVVPSQQLED